MSVCGKHSQVRALFCEQDLEVLVPLSSSPDHQGHQRRSRLVNSPLRLRERSRWKSRDRKYSEFQHQKQSAECEQEAVEG